MLNNKDLSHINNLKDLKLEMQKANLEIELSENRLEQLFSNLPMQALGGAVGFVASAIAKGFQGPSKSEKERTPESDDSLNLGQTLKSVGEETASFALAKLIEKLLAQR